jgi:phosphoglycerate dehydrogenase-like enzyme
VHTVVAFGPLDEEIVTGALGDGVRFVAEPTVDDLAAADGAIVRANVTIDAAVLDTMPSLRVIARTGVGTERVDVAEANRRGIPVVITPGSNTNAVAEGALAMALHLTKNLGQLTALVRDDRWTERDAYPVGDIDGSTVGIIGWGRIGRRFGELAGALGAHVIAFDPVADIPAETRVATLEELLKRSDIVSLHAPLVESTHHLINGTSLASVKPGAVVINCSRGPLIDLDAVHRALTEGRIAGLALDVFDEEPALHHPVMDDPRVVLTPHVMGLSRRAAAQTFHDAAVGVRDVLDGREPAAVAVPS